MLELVTALCSFPHDPLPCDSSGLPTCSPELSLLEEVQGKGVHGACLLTSLRPWHWQPFTLSSMVGFLGSIQNLLPLRN